MADDQTALLTRLVAESPLFNNNRNIICADYQWARCLRGQCGTWELIESGEPLFELPELEAGLSSPDEVFPEVIQLGHVALQGPGRRLAASDDSAVWNDRSLLTTLSIPVADVFKNGAKLRYLVRFLEDREERRLHTSAVAIRLRAIAHEALQHVPLSILRKNGSSVRRFLGFVSPGRRVRVKVDVDDSQLADSVMSGLLQHELDLLLVPDALDPVDRASTGELEIGDAETLLRCLAQSDADWEKNAEFVEFRTQLALRIIEKTNPRPGLLQRCSELALFSAHDCRQKKGVVLSIRALRGLQSQAGTLFRYSPPGHTGCFQDFG